MRVIRSLFLKLVLVGPLVLLVLVLVMPFGEPTLGMGALAAAFAIESIIASRWASRRRLDTTSPEALSSSFRQSFFLAFALAEFGMMMTFVMSFIADGYWPYPIGLAGYLIAMAQIAPSRHNLEWRDEDLKAQGSRYLLTEVLSTPPR